MAILAESAVHSFAREAAVLLIRGEAPAALQVCTRGRRRVSRLPDRRTLMLGRCYEALGQYAEAAVEFRRVGAQDAAERVSCSACCAGSKTRNGRSLTRLSHGASRRSRWSVTRSRSRRMPRLISRRPKARWSSCSGRWSR